MVNATAAFSGFSVNNLELAKDFYTNVLGLTILSEKMGLELELPLGAQVFIYEKPDHVPATFTVLNFVVDSIDNTAQELIRHGVKFERYELGEGVKQDTSGILRGLAVNMGPDIAWFKDPAGNILSILQEK